MERFPREHHIPSRMTLQVSNSGEGAAFDRMKGRIFRDQAVSEAKAEMFSDNLDDRFKELEKGDEIERMLAEVKSRRQLNG